MNKHIEGIQITPPWHIDNFELMAFANQYIQKDAYPHFPKNRAFQKAWTYYKSPFKGGISYQ